MDKTILTKTRNDKQCKTLKRCRFLPPKWPRVRLLEAASRLFAAEGSEFCINGLQLHFSRQGVCRIPPL